MSRENRYDDREFLNEIQNEAIMARSKFPSSNLSFAALVEEVGELAQAMLKRRAGKASDYDVFSEAVQVAVMAMRIVTEGDASFNAVEYHDE